MTAEQRNIVLFAAACLLGVTRLAHAADHLPLPLPPPANDADDGYSLPGLTEASFRTELPAPAPPPILQTSIASQSGIASWYGNAWRGRRTASGTRFNPDAMTAASHSFPLGTRVLVTLEGTARSVLVTITDRQGTKRRIIDLSMAAARKLGMLAAGTGHVTLRRA